MKRRNTKATRGRGKGVSKSVGGATGGAQPPARGSGQRTKATRGRTKATRGRGGAISRIAGTRRTGQKNRVGTSTTPRKIDELKLDDSNDDNGSKSDSGSATISEPIHHSDDEDSDINVSSKHINEKNDEMSDDQHSQSEEKNDEISETQLVHETAGGNESESSSAAVQKKKKKKRKRKGKGKGKSKSKQGDINNSDDNGIHDDIDDDIDDGMIQIQALVF